MIILLNRDLGEDARLNIARRAIKGGFTNVMPFFSDTMAAFSCAGERPGYNLAALKLDLAQLPGVEDILLADAIY